MTVRGFASGRVKLDKQGRVTVKGHLTRWSGPCAEFEPFRFPQDYRQRQRRKDYDRQQGRGQVVQLDILELCAHLRRWDQPCTDCQRGRNRG